MIPKLSLVVSFPWPVFPSKNRAVYGWIRSNFSVRSSLSSRAAAVIKRRAGSRSDSWHFRFRYDGTNFCTLWTRGAFFFVVVVRVVVIDVKIVNVVFGFIVADMWTPIWGQSLKNKITVRIWIPEISIVVHARFSKGNRNTPITYKPKTHGRL